MIKVKLAKAEFKEEDHPRAKDGKFGSGGGGKKEAAPKEKQEAKPAPGKHELTSSNTHKIPISPKTPRPSEFIPAPPAIDVPPQVEKGMAVTAAARAAAFDGQPKYIARNPAGKLRVSRDKPESGEYAKVTATFSEKDGYSITVENYSVKAGEPAQVEKPKPETPKPKPEPKPVTTAGPDPAAMAAARAAFLKKNPGAEAALAKKYKFMHGPMSMDEFVQKAASSGAYLKRFNGEDLIIWGNEDEMPDVVQANKDVKAYFNHMKAAANVAPAAPPATVSPPVTLPVAVTEPKKTKEEPKKQDYSNKLKTPPVPISTKFDMKVAGPKGKKISKTIEKIDALIGVPSNFGIIPIKSSTTGSTHGSLTTRNGVPLVIHISTGSTDNNVEMTTAHEIGHYIDYSSNLMKDLLQMVNEKNCTNLLENLTQSNSYLK
jgi:hypothetical protein